LDHEKIVQAACGNKHSIALTNSGEIYMWGQYEVGDPDVVIRETTLSFVTFSFESSILSFTIKGKY